MQKLEAHGAIDLQRLLDALVIASHGQRQARHTFLAVEIILGAANAAEPAAIAVELPLVFVVVVEPAGLAEVRPESGAASYALRTDWLAQATANRRADHLLYVAALELVGKLRVHACPVVLHLVVAVAAPENFTVAARRDKLAPPFVVGTAWLPIVSA